MAKIFSFIKSLFICQPTHIDEKIDWIHEEERKAKLAQK